MLVLIGVALVLVAVLLLYSSMHDLNEALRNGPAEIEHKAIEILNTVLLVMMTMEIVMAVARMTSGTLLPLPVLAHSAQCRQAGRGAVFPAQIKQAFPDWRTGFPYTDIDDNAVDIVRGTGAQNIAGKVVFRQEVGLAVRLVRYSETPIGVNPRQIDYADYRDVCRSEVAFRWTVTWSDGRSVTELGTLQPNQPIDASKFRPNPSSGRKRVDHSLA